MIDSYFQIRCPVCDEIIRVSLFDNSKQEFSEHLAVCIPKMEYELCKARGIKERLK